MYLLAIAILLPALSAALCYILRNSVIRNIIVVLTTLAMFGVAGGFISSLMASPDGRIAINLEHAIPLNIGLIIKILDVALLVYVAYVGLKLKNRLIVLLSVLQLVPVIIFEFFTEVKEPEFAFVIDYLSLILVLLVSIIGPLITVFAIGYMKEHEHHLHLKVSRQPRFFMILFVFLAAMNALAMTNNLSWMYFFWEVTTLCSFLLIGHDGNEIAVKNAARALWLNSLGGVAFIAGIIAIYTAKETLAVDEIAKAITSTGDFVGLMPIGLGLLCFAAFTKAAQFPFQSWLLGAMVAPTPVSALLHSSTMVKAGVYLVVRMAPAFSGTMLGKMVAVVGAFTFVAGSAIAISQSNGKKVLAYSTIANLGLIICCAGIGTNIALGAAMLLMIFHAVSKGLMFLCVGTVELGIGSRDIEDMNGLIKRMPFTAVIMLIGMISMLLPPFGVLITKWLALEAAVNMPIILVLIILGSAFTVVFWAKWIGGILAMSYKEDYPPENVPGSIKTALSVMLIGVFAASVGIMPLFNSFIAPQLKAFGLADKSALLGQAGGVVLQNADSTILGGFASIVVFGIIFLLILLIPALFGGTKAGQVRPPYLCGENVKNDAKGLEFVTYADKVEKVAVRNFYLANVFGESSLTLWTNAAAIAIILIMFGAVIK